MVRHVLPLLFIALLASAEAPRLVPVSDAAIPAASSNPRDYLRIGSVVVFHATDAAHGEEVWRSDGTAEGTFLLRDFKEGPGHSFVRIIGRAGNDAVMLDAESDGRRVLWRSDGTPAGTVKLGEIPYSGSGFRAEVYPADTRVFVLVEREYGGPRELWVSDLAPGSLHKIGTYPLQFEPRPVGADGRLFAAGSDAASGTQLWVSDGTALRTHTLPRFAECPGPSCDTVIKRLFRVNGSVCFLTADALWRTDGTPSGTTKVVSLDDPELAAISPSLAWLTVGEQFWRTDGSSTGTRPAGPSDRASATYVYLLDDGRLLLLDLNQRPFRILLQAGDGTEAVPIATFNVTGPRSSAPFLGALGNRVLLAAAGPASSDTELWVLDLDTHALTLVKDLDPRQGLQSLEAGSPEYGFVFDGRVLFSARTSIGRELWSSDGTAAGTVLVKNINPEASGGIVSGRVRSAVDGAPLANAFVGICASENQCQDYARTDAEGRFRLEGMAPGEYVAIAGQFPNYLSQFYDGVDCPCPPGSARRFAVNAGFETSGIEFSLKKGSTISGTVRRATGEPLSGIGIVVRNLQGQIFQQVQSFEGAYAVHGLIPGQYFVETRAYGLALVDQIHPGRNCVPAPCTTALGQPVTIAAFGSTVDGIDFSLQPYQTISGTIRSSTGHPAAFVSVRFVHADESDVGTTTDADGVYHSPPLPPNPYFVRVGPTELYDGAVYPNAPCPTYDCVPTGTPVNLGLEPVTGIDLTLTQKVSRITGVILDRNGAPFSEVPVALLDHEGYFAGYSGSDITGEDGHYTIDGMPLGRYWLLALDELYGGVDCPFFNPCPTMEGATPIDVTAGSTITVNMQLRSERVSISGRLLDAKTGASVDDADGIWILSGTTGREIPSLDDRGNGSYRVTFISREQSFYVIASARGWHRTAYPNVRLTCDTYTLCAPPGSVLVGAGVKTGIDITLMPKGVISGTVTDAATGKPIEDAQVFFTRNGQFIGNTFTEEGGRYRWPYGDGSYNVHAEPYGGEKFTPQVYRNRDCTGACDPKTGDVVTAANGTDAANVDFHVKLVDPPGRISGRVVDDETGAGIENVYVDAHAGHGSESARTDAQGNYTIAIRSGEYRIYAEAQQYYVSVYGGPQCADLDPCDLDAGTPVRVTGPNTAGGIDFHLIRPHVMSIAPDSGPPEGGTRIVIAGKHFTADAKVKIGDAEAQIVSVKPTEIVALTPPGPVGPAHVTVVLSSSVSATLTHGYTYTSTSPRRRNSRH